MSLESELNAFSKLFKAVIQGAAKAEIRWVTAKEIDWDKKTMTAADADGLEYFKVMLGLKTNFVKPKVESYCLIAIVEGQETVSVLIHADDSEEVWIDGDTIVINGGKNGGLTNTPEIKTQLEKLSKRVDGIIDAIKNAVPLAQDGGAKLKADMVLSLATLTDIEDFSKIENEKVKH